MRTTGTVGLISVSGGADPYTYSLVSPLAGAFKVLADGTLMTVKKTLVVAQDVTVTVKATGASGSLTQAFV